VMEAIINTFLFFFAIILGLVAVFLAIGFIGLSVYSMIGFEEDDK